MHAFIEGVYSKLCEFFLNMHSKKAKCFFLFLQVFLAMIFMGSGDPTLENNYKKLAEDFSQSAAVRIGYNNALAHQIEAGCDFFLMPSRFEPCGLNQLYSMAYGTIPIVRATGGLADTVKTWNEETGDGSGIVFNNSDSPAIEWAINQALKLYSSPKDFKAVQKTAMASQFSWNTAAKDYVRTYKLALQSVS